MRTNEKDGSAASHITRILILSYFLALATGLISGAEFSRLATPFLPEPTASFAMSAVVIFLSALVLIGVYRRPAALILALALFWASYMTMFATGDLTGFWRDLALLGGLLMSAGVGAGLSIPRRSPEELPEKEVVQRIVSTPQFEVEAPRRNSITRFREDLNLAREA